MLNKLKKIIGYKLNKGKPMKTTEQIIAGLEGDIANCKAAITHMTPTAYLNGDKITAEQAKLNFALRLLAWIKS